MRAMGAGGGVLAVRGHNSKAIICLYVLCDHFKALILTNTVTGKNPVEDLAGHPASK